MHLTVSRARDKELIEARKPDLGGIFSLDHSFSVLVTIICFGNHIALKEAALNISMTMHELLPAD